MILVLTVLTADLKMLAAAAALTRPAATSGRRCWAVAVVVLALHSVRSLDFTSRAAVAAHTEGETAVRRGSSPGNKGLLAREIWLSERSLLALVAETHTVNGKCRVFI